MYNIPNYEDREPIDTKKLIACTKKILSDVVYNMSDLEGNPFTFPEVQTLLDGITIGGHKLSDQDQVIRIRDSWELVFRLAQNEEISLNDVKLYINDIHSVVAKDEALIVGAFRIKGTQVVPFIL